MERAKLEIPGSGLEAIGDTRFATMYYSALSMRQCLPAICNLVGAKEIEIKVSFISLRITPLILHTT